jgi:hypothetical protein
VFDLGAGQDRLPGGGRQPLLQRLFLERHDGDSDAGQQEDGWESDHFGGTDKLEEPDCQSGDRHHIPQRVQQSGRQQDKQVEKRRRGGGVGQREGGAQEQEGGVDEQTETGHSPIHPPPEEQESGIAGKGGPESDPAARPRKRQNQAEKRQNQPQQGKRPGPTEGQRSRIRHGGLF